MADFFIKTDDTAPVLSIQASYSDGTHPDLTGAAVTFAMKNNAGTVVINDVAAAIDSPLTAGKLHYNWTAGDTATAGSYLGEFHITLASGKRLSVPNGQYLHIHIMKDIP